MLDKNLPRVHRLQAERLGPRVALRYRRHGVFHDLTWDRYRADVLACAAALVEAGVRPGDRVGLVAENRVEWLVADMGLLTAAAVNVPPHAPLTAKQVQFQLADAGVTWLFVSTAAQLAKVRQVRADLPLLRGVVVFDRDAAGEDALSWAGFLQRGRRALPAVAAELARREEALGPDDLATIMYTSGTTGNPKGVMLSHDNLLSNCRAALEVDPPQPGDLVLNWLPFSHIYARTIDYYAKMAAGVPVCLSECAETVLRDLAELPVTHLSCVPRLLEKVLSAVASADPAETGRRLRKVFGPHVRWIGSGGAPLPVSVGEAYAAAGVRIYQGYGLTESSPGITFNGPGHWRVDTVGKPIPGVEVKVAADGEVLARGPNIMKGYWNNPQGTAETIRDGWLHTGDLGELDPDGHLRITGRKKELLVLSNGKKVVPPYLEGLLLGDPCIDQAVVCGEGRNFLTALIVPNWDNLRREMGTADGLTPEALARDERVRACLEKRIGAALAEVSPAERVKKFVVLPEPFTVAADELTVSLKLRRQVVLAKHASALERLYREGDPANPAAGPCVQQDEIG